VGHVHGSRARRHVTEDTSDQGQKDTIKTILKIINQSTHFINEQLYMSYLTTVVIADSWLQDALQGCLRRPYLQQALSCSLHKPTWNATPSHRGLIKKSAATKPLVRSDWLKYGAVPDAEVNIM